MTPTILTVRLNRRAIGAVALSGETLTLAQGRHLTSRPERGPAAALRYVAWLLDLTKPALLVVDAPSTDTERTSGRIRERIKRLALEQGIPLLLVARVEILTAFGLGPLRDRQELRELVRTFWPELRWVQGKVEPYVVDAAAAALYADCRLALERIPA